MPHHKQSTRATLEDFLYKGDDMPPQAPILLGRKVEGPEKTMLQLRDTRDRYIRKNWRLENDTGQNIIRAAVLEIFEQAFDKLALLPRYHEQIASEVLRKIKVVLGIIDAEPSEPVFLSAGQLLNPLEPQYAQPRITEFSDDKKSPEWYEHRTQHRLEQWRAEGWPEVYPEKAVKREEKEQGKWLAMRKIRKADGRKERRAELKEEMMLSETTRTNEDLGGIVEVANVDGEVASRTPPVKMRRDSNGRLVVEEEVRDSDDWD